MEIKSINNSMQFGAKIHKNTLQLIGENLLSSKDTAHVRGAKLRELQENVKALAAYGDKETTVAMYFPKEGNFIVTNSKLGTSMIKHGHGAFSRKTALESISDLTRTPGEVEMAERQLFEQYMVDMEREKGMSPMQVLDDLREKGEFAKKYIGENGAFTFMAKARTEKLQKYNSEQARMIETNGQIKEFLEGLRSE